MLFLILAFISFLSCIMSLFLKKPILINDLKVAEQEAITSERHLSSDITSTSLLDIPQADQQ